MDGRHPIKTRRAALLRLWDKQRSDLWRGLAPRGAGRALRRANLWMRAVGQFCRLVLQLRKWAVIARTQPEHSEDLGVARKVMAEYDERAAALLEEARMLDAEVVPQTADGSL